MTKTETELVDKLRRSLGGVSTTRIAHAALIDAVDSALREYSRFGGDLTVGSFTTVANQASYSYNPSLVAIVLNVLTPWVESAIESFERSVGGGIYPYGGAGDDASAFDYPSVAYADQYKRQERGNLFEGSFRDTGRAIILMPSPTEAGRTIYYDYRARLELADVPDMDEDIFLLWAEATAVEKLAFQSQVLPNVTGGGQSASWPAPPDVSDTVSKKKQEFWLRMSAKIR